MTDTQRVFHALADPTRRQLIEILTQEGEQTVTALADRLPITRQGVTKHLTILLEAGLVSVRAAGRERHYSAAPEPLGEASTWLDTIGALWDERLERLRSLVEDDTD